MAYWISKGNRGYIFLISILKLVYLITTCAYCFQYIANYMTSLTVIFMGANTVETTTAWTIWGIYVAWLSLIAGSMFYLYFTNKCYASLLPYARVMFYAVVASLGLLICLLVILTSASFKRFSYREICYNGGFLENLSPYTWQGENYCCKGQIQST